MLLEELGIDDRIPDEYTPDQVRELLFNFQEPSKVGAANGGTSGTGTKPQDNSDQNTENK